MRRKITALALAFALAASTLAPAADAKAEGAQTRAVTNGSMETASEIQPGQNYNVELSEGEAAYYRFTPEESGVYAFASSGSADTEATLYAADKTELAYNDDGDEDYNFYLKYCLEAGESYYLKASELSGGAASFSIQVTWSAVDALELYFSTKKIFITYGQSVTLRVAAAVPDGQQAAYQWQVEKDGNDEAIAGATGNSYTIPADNKYTIYSCQVTCGEQCQTAYFTLDIDTGLTVSSAVGTPDEDDDSYRTVNLTYGTGTTLSVTAAGGLAAPTYQWYAENEDGYYEAITDAVNSDYAIDGKTMGDYRCTATDGVTVKTITFRIIIDSGLTVSSTVGTPDGGDDSYRIVNLTYGTGTTLSVTASSNSTSPITYQWYSYNYDEEEDDWGYQSITNATNSDYAIDGKTEGRYRCTVTDGSMTESVIFIIKIDSGLTVSSTVGTPDEDDDTYRTVTAEYGTETMLSVTAAGTINTPTYQWYSENEDGDYMPIADAVNPNLTIDGKTAGYYRCSVTDGVVTKSMTFRIRINSGFTASTTSGTPYNYGDTDRLLNIAGGEPVTLTVNAESKKPLSYEWSKYDPASGRFSGIACTENSYTIPNAENGSYQCTVTDGNDSETFTFDILADIDFRWNGPANTMIISGTGIIPQRIMRYFYSIDDEGLDGDGVGIHILIEDGVTGIESEAFCKNIDVMEYGLYVRNVTIPDSVKQIGEHAVGYFYDYTYDEDDNEIKTYIASSGTIYCTKDSAAYKYAQDNGIKYDIESLKNLAACTVSLPFESTVYTGSDISPVPVVKDGENTLSEGTDYTLAYADNTNAGNAASVTIIGTGAYTGRITKTFQITPRPLTGATVAFASSTYNYNGRPATPGVTVTINGKQLTAGTDYDVAYGNNTNIGSASAVITGKNNYTGTVTDTFRIKAKKGSIHTVKGYKYKILSNSAVSLAGLKSKKTTKVSVPKTVKIGGKAFKVTAIAAKALRNSNIKSITIGDNVKTIGKSAFEGCKKLTRATAGAGVTTIDASAFKNCKKLGTITIKSKKLKKVGKKAFSGIKSNARIKVPSKKLKAYKRILNRKGQGKKVKITK